MDPWYKVATLRKEVRDAREICMQLYEFNPAVFAVMAYRPYVALGDRGPLSWRFCCAKGSINSSPRCWAFPRRRSEADSAYRRGWLR